MEAIPVREIHRVQIEGGHLRVTSHGGRTLAIGSLDAPGALRELAERLNAA